MGPAPRLIALGWCQALPMSQKNHSLARANCQATRLDVREASSRPQHTPENASSMGVTFKTLTYF